MNEPTKQQWDEFKQELSGRYGTQYLQCDGYAVSINIEMSNKRALHYVVYVNGWLNGKWIKAVKEDEIDSLPEEAKRFYMHNKKGRPSKEIKIYEKIYGKHECKKMGFYKKQVLAMPFWKSLNSLIAHFKKHNQQISIVSQEDYELMIKKSDLTASTE